MKLLKLWIPLCLLLITATSALSVAWAAGIALTESKEQLGLDYEFSANAKDGTVIVTLTIKDLGKLKPLQGVVLTIHSDKKDDHRPDVYVPLATKQDGGKLTAWAQLSREMAERATVQLVPESPPDGGKVAGWVFHPIAVREHIKDVP